MAIVGPVFFDTSILLAGLVEMGDASVPAARILDDVARGAVSSPVTAWHCCLEFFSVATRLPPEFRLPPADAVQLLEEEVFARMTVHDLPPADRLPMLRTAARDRVAGGRIHDVHIAEVARAARTDVIVTDNRRHFLTALRHGTRVETPPEFLAGIKRKRS